MTRNRARKEHNRKVAHAKGISYTKASREPGAFLGIDLTQNRREPVYISSPVATPFWDGRSPGEKSNLLIFTDFLGVDSPANVLARQLYDIGENVWLASRFPRGTVDRLADTASATAAMIADALDLIRRGDASSRPPCIIIDPEMMLYLERDKQLVAQLGELVSINSYSGIRVVLSGSYETFRNARIRVSVDVLYARSSVPSLELMTALSHTLPTRHAEKGEGILFSAGLEPRFVTVAPAPIPSVGEPPRWLPNANADHLLITGDSGSGKSGTLQKLARSLVLRGAEVHYLARAQYEDFPSELGDAATTLDQISATVSEVLDRKRSRERPEGFNDRSPIFLAIEDATYLLDPDHRASSVAVRDAVREIASAKGLGVHLLVAGKISLLHELNMPLEPFDKLFLGFIQPRDWSIGAQSSGLPRPSLRSGDELMLGADGSVRLSRGNALEAGRIRRTDGIEWRGGAGEARGLLISGTANSGKSAAARHLVEQLKQDGHAVATLAGRHQTEATLRAEIAEALKVGPDGFIVIDDAELFEKSPSFNELLESPGPKLVVVTGSAAIRRILELDFDALHAGAGLTRDRIWLPAALARDGAIVAHGDIPELDAVLYPKSGEPVLVNVPWAPEASHTADTDQ